MGENSAVTWTDHTPTTKTPICSVCNDTHRVPAPEDRGGEWMCTSCPVPCQACRAGGTGPFCEKAPCACACHAAHHLISEATRVEMEKTR